MVHYETALEIAKVQGHNILEVYAYLGLGKVYKSENKTEMASVHYDKALNIARKQEYQLQETKAYLALGELCKSSKQNYEAIQYYEKVLYIAREQGYETQETQAYFELAEAYRFENHNKKAIPQYEKFLEIAREQGNKLQETQAYLGLGETYRSDTQNQRAIDHHKKALQIAKEQGYQKEETQACLWLGEAYRLNNQIITAILYYIKGLNVAKKQGCKQQETLAYLWLGKAYRAHNMNQIATQYYKKGLKIAKEQGYKLQETEAYLGLGEAYKNDNQNQLATQCYEKGLEIAREKGYKLQEQQPCEFENSLQAGTQGCKKLAKNKNEELSKYADSCENNHGATGNVSDTTQLQDAQQETVDDVDFLKSSNESSIDDRITSKEQLLLEHSYGDGSKNEDEIKSCKIATPFTDEREHRDSKAKAYQHLGSAAVGNREYEKAVKYYQKAHKMSPELNADETEVTAYQWLGYNHLQVGQYQESIKYYSAVVKFATHLGYKMRKVNAYLGLGCAFVNTGDFESSRQYYSKAMTTAHDKRLKRKVHINLGHVYYKSCMFDAALKSYLKAQELFNDLDESQQEANDCLMLGHTLRQLKQHEKAIEYYGKASSIDKEVNGEEMERYRDKKSLERIINEWCGYCCRFVAGKHEEAITFYEKAKEIAKQDGEKYQEYRTNQAIGNILWKIGNFEKAKNYYQEALENAIDLQDKYCEGTSYLDLASVSSKEFDYEMAQKWYEKALYVFETEHNDHILKEKALIGLGIAWFNLRKTQKATETIRKARELFAKDETDEGNTAVSLTDQHNPVEKSSTPQTADNAAVGSTDQHNNTKEKLPPLQIQESSTAEVTKAFREGDPITEWVTYVIEKPCNPSTAERLPNKDLAYLEKYIEEFSASYVYTHRASSKDPLTEKLRESMTRNVKTSAYENLLNPENKCKSESNEGKFAGENEDEDEQFFNDTQLRNYAREDVFKNASTRIPARLLEPLGSYTKSIGQIACGSIRGTCWLVTDSVVITNHHVYMAINTERMECPDTNLPITVSFDYLRPGQKEHILTVKVDEERDPQVESAQLDYKFLRLEEDEGLSNRVRLGSIVRMRSSQGLVAIVGHPAGAEMHHETCVVVGDQPWRGKLEHRHRQTLGMHMTNERLLQVNKFEEQGCLAYDTTLFYGTSGSPVFDLNGNIVAMHTQGYPLNVGEHKYSIMEFGIQFSAICEDLKRRNLLQNYFPNYNLRHDQEPMDEDNNEVPMEE